MVGPPSIVIAALGDFQDLVARPSRHAINQSVLLSNAARPPAGKGELKRFRLAETAKRIALNVLNERVDLLMRVRIVIPPVQVVLPGLLGPAKPHSCGSMRPR